MLKSYYHSDNMTFSYERNDDMKDKLKMFTGSIIISGIFLLMMGIYYSMFKAGLPYQDPPLELQVSYAIDSGIGKNLTELGLVVFVFGLISNIMIRIISKKK